MQSVIKMRSLVYYILLIVTTSCNGQQKTADLTSENKVSFYQNQTIKVGAEQLDQYISLLENKKVGLVVNQTSTLGNTHLADTLLALNIQVKKIFAPEHGFRGTADAGESIKNGIDTKSGLPTISLYGNNKKPSKEQIADLDVIIFDIQDVGARFYTYISTMHYVMEACAENNKTLIVLDRPNPNGHYVDGPVMETENQSFVGMHSVPIVHGMTVGEYAQMINGEGWLTNSIKCNLIVIPCKGYDHTTFYELPIAPSPNLPNMNAIYLYPTLCLLEGTDISVGRGTNKQFQVIGSPNISEDRLGADFYNMKANYQFTPQSMPGAKSPPHLGVECLGFDFTANLDLNALQSIKHIDYKYLQGIYQLHNKKEVFFNDFFIKLAGTNSLKQLITNPENANAIFMKYEVDLTKFKKIRAKYLLYKDFE